MSVEESAHPTAEPLGAWLDKKPYWEQYLWDLCSKHDSITDEHVQRCYQLLCEDVGILPPVDQKREKLTFEDLGVAVPAPVAPKKLRIRLIRDFQNVNALSPGCTLPLGPNLTLVFGRNGTGKSGIARLLANACFARGKREVLPNVLDQGSPKGPASAILEIDEADGVPWMTYQYIVGTSTYQDLRRFCVFDRQSVLIHLDERNRVQFVPPYIVIFDRVAKSVERVENQVVQEKSRRRRGSPFAALFSNPKEVTDVSTFCKAVSAETTDEQLDAYTNFDEALHGKRIERLEEEIGTLKRLDVPAKKAQLLTEKASLEALISTLQTVLAQVGKDEAAAINMLTGEIAAQRLIVQRLGAKSFDDGLFQTTGSAEWKAFIKAAKTLYDQEKKALAGKDPTHCLLCHQSISAKAADLHAKYWEFLASEAEADLSRLLARRTATLERLRRLRMQFPTLPESDSAVAILLHADGEYLTNLRRGFEGLASLLEGWIDGIERSEQVVACDVAAIDLEKLRALASDKEKDASELVDPSDAILRLTQELLSLNHRRAASAVKDKALEYLAYLRWAAKIDRVNFPGIKSAITRKRTDSFLLGVLSNYLSKFNEELEGLGCKFSLNMAVGGEQGSTTREYFLESAGDHSPSHVLSEGEQNVCSLADFLTETQLDPNNCGIFLDDPVSSLDHERKGRIAVRLVKEAQQRQVVIFTHDLAFMKKLVDAAVESCTPFVPHWIQKLAGTPGIISPGTSPKLASVAALKADANNAIKAFDSLGPKEQEGALGIAFDYLRSACEGLIEEYLFAKVMQRYDDQVSVQRLQEAVLDQSLAQRIVDMHGKLSEFIPAHNRSDEMREDLGVLADFHEAMADFTELEDELKKAKKESRNQRHARDEAEKTLRSGW